jgi:hypothetical protein
MRRESTISRVPRIDHQHVDMEVESRACSVSALQTATLLFANR